eukprot:g6555.t1
MKRSEEKRIEKMQKQWKKEERQFFQETADSEEVTSLTETESNASSYQSTNQQRVEVLKLDQTEDAIIDGRRIAGNLVIDGEESEIEIEDSSEDISIDEDTESSTIAISQDKVILAKFNPVTQTLRLEADVHWTTSAFQIVLTPVLKSTVFRNVKAPFRLSHLDLTGRMRMTMNLAQTQPGIKTCDISFLETPPVLTMRITPIGMELEDFPGIPESLRATIVKLLTKRMVDPKFLTIDVQTIFNRLRERRRGGENGLLWITINTLNGPSLSSESLELYCEFEFQGLLLRTPIQQAIQSFTWNWKLGLELVNKIPDDEDSVLEIKIYRVSPLEEPSVFASGEVLLNTLGLAPGMEAKAHTLRLRGVHESEMYTLHLTLQWSTPSLSVSLSAKTSDAVSSSSSLDTSKAQIHDDEKYQKRVGELERTILQLRKEFEENTSNDGFLPHALEATSPFAQSGLFSGRLGMESETNGDLLSTGFVNLLQVTKLHEALEHDRSRHKRHLSYLESYISDLESKLEHEKTKRLDEGVIALKEGGRFIVHKANERVLRFLWYEQNTSMLNWAIRKQSSSDGQVQGVPVKSQALHLVSEVSMGTRHFPERTFFAWDVLKTLMQGRWNKLQFKKEEPVEDNCFSIVFSNSKALNLEIPEGGNGRSRNAWVEALQALILKQ